MDWRVISIGAMSANALWGEREPVRTGHATTTLVRTTNGSGNDMRILVDPGLPGPALTARLRERVNLSPSDITHVFLTSFHPDTRRGLEVFENATWWIAEGEREAVGVPLATSLMRLSENFEEPDSATRAVLESDIATLQRCEAAPDRLGTGVDLFPMPGVSPGLCGLLLTVGPTVLICGDAIVTQDHLERGEVARYAADIECARESFGEAVEIADVLILGRDNAVPNHARRGV
jgi:glyoxylase-like metal-dependent hydrolase (beta-lactamase superfamily II)